MKSSSSAALLQRRAAVVPRGVSRLNDVTAASADGAHITDFDGRRYIDLATGIGVMAIGHGHPGVVEAIAAQAAALSHTCFHVATYEPYVALCEALAKRFPHGDATKVMLVNSGAEAVENAIKIARQATGRSAVICFTGGFHGRTLLGFSLTSSVGYKRGCGPYAPELYRLPFPDRRAAPGASADEIAERELARLRRALLDTVPGDQVAAVILEVVQGEGGFVPCPPAYLRGLREVCDEHGILLICDEVQTGFGRTGRWAAYEHAGITPDLSTWAKAMGGGLPISSVIGKAAVMDAALPGTLGGTYGGNPVACAAALATLRAMESMDLPERAAQLGRRIEARLRAMAARSRIVSDVRGFGQEVAPATVSVGADPLDDVTLTLVTDDPTQMATVDGSLNIVDAPGGSVTSVVLVPASVYNASVERGPVPVGLRVPDPPAAVDVTSAFRFDGVPAGTYEVLVAFENDDLVRDPDEGIAGTAIPEIMVTAGEPMTLSESFKVTAALAVTSPGRDAPEVVDSAPTFVFADDSSEDGYVVVVYDALGRLTWETEVPGVSGSDTVEVPYGGPQLTPGMYYQFRATSFRDPPNGDRTFISRTEDLRGVFVSGVADPEQECTVEEADDTGGTAGETDG